MTYIIIGILVLFSGFCFFAVVRLQRRNDICEQLLSKYRRLVVAQDDKIERLNRELQERDCKRQTPPQKPDGSLSIRSGIDSAQTARHP